MKILLTTLTLSSLLVWSVFTDSRDGNNYSEIDLAGNTWLKENMRYLFDSTGQKDSYAFKSSDYDTYGAYYHLSAAKNVCPEGYHLPSLHEWLTVINNIPGKNNSRQGKLVPKSELAYYGLTLGGMASNEKTQLAGVMGFYWTATDTLKVYHKEPDNGNQRHLVGIHVWSSGEQDSINVEPTYMLAKAYEPVSLLNCKCVQD